jgi:hypothetical protein
MSVDPLKSNAMSQADPGRRGSSAARRSDASSTTENQPDQPGAAGDRVQLSAASKSLVERTDDADRVPEGTMTPERMSEVLRRLQTDHYNSAEVRDKVAHEVRKDLGLSRTE